MLRITIHDNLESLTFQLEGRLAGAWVRLVEECRQRTLAGRRGKAVRFDLTGVTFIDAAGKAYLAAMHRLGAEFVAADCLTNAVVAEISKAPIHKSQKSEIRDQHLESPPTSDF
jgi:ABC-type transporter Mla MlaB component